jgi:tetratricopeptide (TPR) repeat protein
MRFTRHLSAILVGATVTIMQPQISVALTPTQVSDIAKDFTVLIGGDGIGSGVIFDRKGETYYVLTNRHVVVNDGRYEIQTPDGSKYPVYRSQELPGLDLAVLQFTSNKTYRPANIGNSDQVREGMTVYVVGWADALPGITKERSYQFTDGNVRSRLKEGKDGYTLVYNNEAVPGMSGGPVLDEQGRVVGINGRADTEVRKDGALIASLRLGIPINTFLTTRRNPPPIATGSQTATRQRSAEDYISLGGAKAQRKDYQGAIADYNQALKLSPNNPDAYFRRSNAYFSVGNLQSATEDLNKVVQLNPKNGFAYAMRCAIRLTQKDIPGAVADGEEAVRFAPNLGFAYLARGSARAFLPDYQGAIADINKFIEQEPSFAHAYAVRGFSRAGLGDRKGANDDFDQALKLDPNFFSTYQLRGVVRGFLWGDKPGALADLHKASDLIQKEGNQFLYQEIQNSIKFVENPASASQQVLIEPFNEAIARNPNDANAYFYRGSGYYIQGDKQNALADITKATQINPKFSIAWFAQGDIFRELGKFTEARNSYNRAIQANSQWGNVSPALAYAYRGLTNLHLGNTQAANADINQALQLDPKNAVAYGFRGLSLQYQKDYRRAVAAYEKAISLDAKLSPAINNLGLVKYELGDVEGAIRHFQTAMNINNTSAESQLALAVALYNKGKQDQGLAMAQAALRLDNRWANITFIKQQFWGDKLIADTQKLLANPKIR